MEERRENKHIYVCEREREIEIGFVGVESLEYANNLDCSSSSELTLDGSIPCPAVRLIQVIRAIPEEKKKKVRGEDILFSSAIR